MLSGRALNKVILSSDQNYRESGERSNPIWLLFNPKHPAVRHYIWTPVLSEIQDKVYRELHTRIDTTKFYIRNAVGDSKIVPNTQNWWDNKVSLEINEFREIAAQHKPKMIISFGAFPYEFVRRVYKKRPEKGPKYWGTTILGDEFGKAMANFDIEKTNIVPLLRRVVASNKFIEEIDLADNYFQYVGLKIAEKIIEHQDSLNIWID